MGQRSQRRPGNDVARLRLTGLRSRQRELRMAAFRGRRHRLLRLGERPDSGQGLTTPKFFKMLISEVARAALQGLASGRPRVIPGWDRRRADDRPSISTSLRFARISRGCYVAIPIKAFADVQAKTVTIARQRFLCA